jgi:hypothetical protein
MGNLQVNQILVQDAKLEAIIISDTDHSVKKLIDETKQKQVEILKLKEVDQERLRMVVQL